MEGLEQGPERHHIVILDVHQQHIHLIRVVVAVNRIADTVLAEQIHERLADRLRTHIVCVVQVLTRILDRHLVVIEFLVLQLEKLQRIRQRRLDRHVVLLCVGMQNIHILIREFQFYTHFHTSTLWGLTP